MDSKRKAWRDTVLILHGTFSGPDDVRTRWYEPGSYFCRTLDASLEANGSPARCWAHLQDCGEELRSRDRRSTTWFSWSGANSWIDRSLAARSLKREVRHLERRGWRCHLVAHSHGGNVAFEAAGFTLEPLLHGDGRAVFLGTPILTYAPHGAGRESWQPEHVFGPLTVGRAFWVRVRPVVGRGASRARYFVGLIVSLGLWSAAFMLLAKVSGAKPVTLVRHSLWTWAAVIAGAPLARFAWFCLMNRIEKAAAFVTWPEPDLVYWGGVSNLPLFINSQRDEAVNFLTAILEAENPFAAPPRRRRPWSQRASTYLRAALNKDGHEYPAGTPFVIGLILLTLALAVLAEAWLGALSLARSLVFCSFLLIGFALMTKPSEVTATLSLPWRTAMVVLRTAASVARAAAVKHIRRRAWRDMRAMAFGLLGAPHSLEDVGVHRMPPKEYIFGHWVYDELPATVESEILAARASRIGTAASSFWHTSEAELWRVEGWRDRLGQLAADPTLVHAAYYQYPEVIERIAVHLACPAERIMELIRARVEDDASGPPLPT